MRFLTFFSAMTLVSSTLLLRTINLIQLLLNKRARSCKLDLVTEFDEFVTFSFVNVSCSRPCFFCSSADVEQSLHVIVLDDYYLLSFLI